MKLVPIPAEQYDEYRLDVIFEGYKWDPQFLDSNTIARHVLLITQQEHAELEKLTEKLDEETTRCEEVLNGNLRLAKPLALPRCIYKELKQMKNYRAKTHIRLMRYDFHPTQEGKWAISEVNSDVPGGFAEASLMPQIAGRLLKGQNCWHKNFGDIMAKAIAKKVKPGGKIMFVHCTSYSDDRQVMQFLGDKVKGMGFYPIYAAADHLRFKNNRAISILDGNRGGIDAIFRFTPLEWLIHIKPKYWQGYFDTTTPSCNHPIAIFAQTKRFPLVWDALEKCGVQLPTWRLLLPHTLEVKDAINQSGYIYKPAHGRVGEGVAIQEACSADEYRAILGDVKKHPKKYLAQKQFSSKPLFSEANVPFHVCLGVYSVEGKAAGYYARISKTPRIDSNAADIPVLIEGRENDGQRCV